MKNPDFWRGKQVLITGGLGFIGSNLAIRLHELGARLTLVDSLIPEYGGHIFNVDPIRSEVLVNVSDVRDPHAFGHLIRGQDVMFNLAGQTSHLDSMKQPMIDLEINARSQLAILEACRALNPQVRIVYASTRQLYGKPAYLPVDEQHPLDPVDVNGINKLAGEQYHLLYSKVYGMRAVALRLTNTYGPRMRVKDARQTFLGIWIRNLIEGKPILVYGDGTQLRDFNYVDDVVEALLLAAVRDEACGKVFNLGHTEHLSLEKVAQLMTACSRDGRYELIPFPADRKAIDIGDYYGDYSLIHAMLGWQPQINLAEGLDRTLAYFRQHRHHYWEHSSDHSHE